jgi:uncharacterized protein
MGFEETRRKPDLWGRLVESAVGAHLLNSALGTPIEVSYWRERNVEVDFVLQRGQTVVGIEVKTAGGRRATSGMAAFSRAFTPRRMLLVGADGIPLEEFLSAPASHWLEE